MLFEQPPVVDFVTVKPLRPNSFQHPYDSLMLNLKEFPKGAPRRAPGPESDSMLY